MRSLVHQAARAVVILGIGLAVVAGCTGPRNSGSAAPAGATPAPASVAPSSAGGYSY